jgi:hypothetical protein
MSVNTITHRVVWGACVIGNCTISFIIAESVPVFGDLLSLLGALVSIPMAIALESAMYIWLRRKEGRPNTALQVVAYVVNAAIVLICAFLTVAGCYSAIVDIRAHVKAGKTTPPFSCGDNSK